MAKITKTEQEIILLMKNMSTKNLNRLLICAKALSENKSGNIETRIQQELAGEALC